MAYVELIAALAADRDVASKLDLLLGVHPADGRWLTEEEEGAWEFIRYLSATAIAGADGAGPFGAPVALWRDVFPEVEQFCHDRHDPLGMLWDHVLERVQTLRLAYAFFPLPLELPPDQFSSRRVAVRERCQAIQREMERGIIMDHRARGRVVWTLPFPAEGPLGRRIEARNGLSAGLKDGLGLGGVAPGLLHCYFAEHPNEIHSLLDPNRFEGFVTAVYAAEGWHVVQTPQTRDGGKDVIATRMVNGAKLLAYIQAKRYQPGRSVGAPAVKEFVATLAGDGVEKGIIVTTSHFSKPARTWLRDKWSKLASVDLVDRERLRHLLEGIAGKEIGAYVMA